MSVILIVNTGANVGTLFVEEGHNCDSLHHLLRAYVLLLADMYLGASMRDQMAEGKLDRIR